MRITRPKKKKKKEERTSVRSYSLDNRMGCGAAQWSRPEKLPVRIQTRELTASSASTPFITRSLEMRIERVNNRCGTATLSLLAFLEKEKSQLVTNEVLKKKNPFHTWGLTHGERLLIFSLRLHSSLRLHTSGLSEAGIRDV